MQRTNMGEETLVAFLDFKKAYDMVPHDVLLFKVRRTGIYEKCYQFLCSLYASTIVYVRIGDLITELI